MKTGYKYNTKIKQMKCNKNAILNNNKKVLKNRNDSQK